jgi:chemotaxis response regulator CheB
MTDFDCPTDLARLVPELPQSAGASVLLIQYMPAALEQGL